MTHLGGHDELARTLRRLRTDAGLTLAEVAGRAGVSIATVSRLENGKYVPTAAQAEALARAVGAPVRARRRVVALATDLRERTAPRQVLIRAGVAGAQRRYGEIEAAAGHVQTFSPAMVSGLLQTADYARLVFVDLPADQAEAAVAARMERQRLLTEPEGPRFTQLLTEGALRWHVGSPELMAAQCARIAELAAIGGRVRVGIIPWRRPVRILAHHGFNLYDERAVIVGTKTGVAFLNARADVALYVELFARLVELADFGEAAARLATDLAADYEGLAAG